MSRHARPASGKGGGWFVALAFAILVVGAYLANAVDSTTQRPAIGLAALAAASLALVSARAERQSRRRMEDLSESQRRDAWRMRAELDEAHARSQRALQRAIAAEAAVQTLMAATDSLLAAQRHTLVVAAAAQNAQPAPVTPALPLAPPELAPDPEQPVAAFGQPWGGESLPGPAGPGVQAPAAALLDPLTTLVWPLADLPAPQREPSLDLPLVRANRPQVTPLFLPVDNLEGGHPASATASGSSPALAATSTAGVEPGVAAQNVDLTSTVTRYARPA